MNATIKTAYAVYSGDERGYSRGDPLSIYPFQAAAANSEENKRQGGYGVIHKVELLNFEDVNFLLDKKIEKKNVVGTVPIGVPTKGYRDYIYNHSFEETKYLVGEKNLITYLDFDTTKSASISKVWLFTDDDNYYVLKSDKNFKIAPFIASRELAVQNALDKLTEEEKGLLGLK